MSRHGLDAASAVDRSELSGGHRTGLAVHRTVLVMSLVVVLLLGVVSGASAASSFYWYGQNNSTCWQTGQLGSPSEACSNVGAGFLATPGGHTGGLEWMDEGAVSSADFLSPSGDYCSYYKLGDDLISQISTNEGSATGLTTPTPYSSYQEGDAHNDVCQADGSHWGREIRDTAPGNSCVEVCGMSHYVSLRSQGTNDRPWSGEFGEPSLVISAEDDPQTFTVKGTNVGAWGYLCPQLEDTATGDILEYCLQEWRGQHNAPQWEQERVSECASVNGHNKDLVSSYFWPGTQFVTERSGSANTYVWQSFGGHHFEAAVTKTDLVNAINRDRTEYVQGERSGEPASGKGCGRSLSTSPESYALIGVSQGSEGWREVTELAGNTANLQLRTEYTPIPPEASTSAASNVQEEQATLNGSVNPKRTDTHYYFQYGETTAYGSSTSEGDAGSGANTTPESATVSNLQPGATYHYRIVAVSSAGTIYGADQVFTAPGGELSSRWATHYTSTYETWVYFQNKNGGVTQLWDSPKYNWELENLNGEVATGTSPTVVNNTATYERWVYFQNKTGGVTQLWYSPKYGWELENIGGEVATGTSPTVVYNTATYERWVYFQNKSGGITQLWYSPKYSWELENVGGEAAAGSSPTAVYDTATYERWVYFRNKSGGITQLWYSPKYSWELENVGGEAAAGSSPTAVHDTATYERWVYFQNKSGGITQLWYSPKYNWELEKIG